MDSWGSCASSIEERVISTRLENEAHAKPGDGGRRKAIGPTTTIILAGEDLLANNFSSHHLQLGLNVRQLIHKANRSLWFHLYHALSQQNVLRLSSVVIELDEC